MSHGHQKGKNAGAPQKQQPGPSPRNAPNNPAEDLAAAGPSDIQEGQEQMQNDQATGQADEGTFDPHMQNGTKLRKPGKDVGINAQGASKQAPSDEL